MKIDIFSDNVCPWCRIGKQNLFEALKQWGEKEQVTIHWRAFQLDPTLPEEGKPFQEALKHKFGGNPEQLEQMFGHVCKVGEACGVPFDFGKIDFMPNTLLSHQLIKITPLEDQTRIAEALLQAYFQDGRNIGDLDVLVNIAAENGFDADIIRHRLSNKEGLAEVEEDLEYARRAQITGVPYFIFNDRFAMSGAQPVQSFLQAFERISQDGRQ